jgi:ATP-dependent helicase/nuclease subunit B
MNNFTDKVAAYIFDQKLSLRHLVVILPSERAKKYLTASLYDRSGKPLLAPKMLTIDQWIRTLSDRVIIDRTRVLIALYNVYIADVDPGQSVDFDEFMSWGTILLSDFDEIDRYKISPKAVFRNLQSIQELEQWSFNDGELSAGQKKFLEFWEKLPDYYEALNRNLDESGCCYAGSAYKFVSENIDRAFQDNKDQVFLFAGFNALSTSEKEIMRQLYRMGRAHILIDADAYYMDDTTHEAGRFLRSLKDYLGVEELPFVSNKLENEKKEIKIIECTQETGQVKVAATVLSEMAPEELDQTLVLLADEDLIVPLVRNLPKKIVRANITLGLPLRSTAVRTWIELLFTIQENRNRFKTNAAYIFDVQRFWNHPFSLLYFRDSDKKELIHLEQELIRRNSIFFNLDNLKLNTHITVLTQLVFQPWNGNWRNAVSIFRQINALLYSYFSEEDELERAAIESLDKGLIDFENLLNEGIPEINLRGFKQLFFQHWSRLSLAYHGNPLSGIQIMGLLETRLLDFKNILVLGLNEGALPPVNPIQTMIPMDLRSYLELPTLREKQGLFAHHYYRLLHQCENMWITYTTSKENIGSNEQSRYILQMELEWSRLNSAVRIERSNYSIPLEQNSYGGPVSIEKTDEIVRRLDEFFTKPVSASALNKFITCPLDFYYRYLLEFGEEETIEEGVESNTFGTIIHSALEALYKPFARYDENGVLKAIQPNNILPKDLDHMLSVFKDYIFNGFLRHFDNDASAFQSGRNLLSYEMACELTERILKKEKAFLEVQTEPVFIEFIEAHLVGEVEIELNGQKRKIALRGFIDRIDSVGGKWRIIDYKSGKVKNEDVKLGAFTADESLVTYFSSTKHAIQLAFYTYLFHQKMEMLPDCACIYSLVNLNQELFTLEAKDMDQKSLMDLFPGLIQELLIQIYDTNNRFEHQVLGQKSWCQYCE